jgi:hypothetical protein
VGFDAALGHVLELVHVEDVEALQVLVEQVEDGRQHAEQDAEDLEPAAAAGRTRAALARRGLGRF